MNTNFNLERRILHTLLIKSYHLPNLGLLSGKMGISLFFIHYFMKTKQCLFRDYALDLIDRITEEVNQDTPLGLDSGLAGIGWGVEYLLSKKFVEEEGDNICEALDNKIMQTDPRRIDDLSLETGMEGLLHYILAHLQGAIMKKITLPFDSTYLKDLYSAVCEILSQEASGSLRDLIKKYKNFYEGQLDLDYHFNLVAFTKKVKLSDKDICSLPLGLRNGLAGYMLDAYINF